MSYTDSFIIAYCCLSALLHFLEIDVLDIFFLVGSTVSGSGVRACISSCTGIGTCLSCFGHIFGCCMPCIVESFGSTVDIGNVLGLVGLFQLAERIFDSTFLVSRDLVTIFLEVLFAL